MPIKTDANANETKILGRQTSMDTVHYYYYYYYYYVRSAVVVKVLDIAMRSSVNVGYTVSIRTYKAYG